MKQEFPNRNDQQQKKIYLDKMNFFNSYEDWSKIKNEFNITKINKRNNGININNIIFKKPKTTYFKIPRKFSLVKKSDNNLIFNSEKEEKKKSPNEKNKAGDNFAKIFKNSLMSLKNLVEYDYSSSSLLNNNKNTIFSEPKNENDTLGIKKTKNKLNQTSSLLSTKLSKSKTIYYNSSLENFYNKISSQRNKMISPLYKINQNKNSFSSTLSNNVNFVNRLLKLYHEENKQNKENRKEEENILKQNNKFKKLPIRTKSFKKILANDKEKEKEEKKDEDKLLYSSGFNSYNQISLKNLFLKKKAKVKSGILDRVIFDYNLQNEDILLHPFSNSYGDMLEDLSGKVKFMKGSIDLVYPTIIQNKYKIKAKQSINKINFLNSNSQENINNKNDIKNIIFSINKDKNKTQTVFTKYPMYIKLKGKFSPHMYTLKGEKKLFYKIQKQKLFSNKIN